MTYWGLQFKRLKNVHLCICRCINASLCVYSLSGSCVVRDASGLINDTLSASSKNCVALACQYGWDFTECINNKTCTYGISNYYQVNTSSLTYKTRKFLKCVFIPLCSQLEAILHCFQIRLQSMSWRIRWFLGNAVHYNFKSQKNSFPLPTVRFFFVRRRNCIIKTVMATNKHWCHSPQFSLCATQLHQYCM